MPDVIHVRRSDGTPCGGLGKQTYVRDLTRPPKRWYICVKCGEQFWEPM